MDKEGTGEKTGREAGRGEKWDRDGK